jgi:small-conductance mechanosensitive channel
MSSVLLLLLALMVTPARSAPAPAPAPIVAPTATGLGQGVEAELAPMVSLGGEIDRDGVKMLQRLTGKVKPWMWWAGGLGWVALVLLVGRLIERGLARLFPHARPSWLGRGFRLFAYLSCALFAGYFFLHALDATLLAGLLMLVEGKVMLLAAATGIADLALLMVNLAIDRYLSRQDGSGQPIERSPRVMTLLPLLRNVAMITLGALLTLVVLGEFGINIAPLIAGAGVVGVAIGFGSQKLVQDVITGAFMLFENTLAVGDWVKIGDHSGTVEGMTIRTLRLRDGNGQVHTLPFSAVPNVINMSRDFGFHPFEINISYDTDIDRALAAIADVVAELREDPAISPDITAPAELFGVERLGEWSVVLSGRIKTPPGRQAVVARAFNRRVKNKFAEQGLILAQRPYNIAAVK